MYVVSEQSACCKPAVEILFTVRNYYVAPQQTQTPLPDQIRVLSCWTDSPASWCSLPLHQHGVLLLLLLLFFAALTWSLLLHTAAGQVSTACRAALQRVQGQCIVNVKFPRLQKLRSYADWAAAHSSLVQHWAVDIAVDTCMHQPHQQLGAAIAALHSLKSFKLTGRQTRTTCVCLRQPSVLLAS